MNLRTSDVVPISDARARLTELAEDVVGNGTEKVLTKNGASYVALIDARKLDHYHALEEEFAGLVMLEAAERGLRDGLAGKVGTTEDLKRMLAPVSLEASMPDTPDRSAVAKARAARR